MSSFNKEQHELRLSLIANRFEHLKSQLDPELVAAVEEFFGNRLNSVLARLVEGEKEYQGQWRKLSKPELDTMIQEEFDDILAYTAMRGWNIQKSLEAQVASRNHPNA